MFVEGILRANTIRPYGEETALYPDEPWRRLTTSRKSVPSEDAETEFVIQKNHIPCRMAGNAECASRMPLL